jgi:hypothetical protein
MTSPGSGIPVSVVDTNYSRWVLDAKVCLEERIDEMLDGNLTRNGRLVNGVTWSLLPCNQNRDNSVLRHGLSR